MKTFRTLRGFVDGDEPEDYEPKSSYQAMLRISSEDRLDFAAISASLGLEPTATRRRGDRAGPRSPPAKHDLWMYRAPVSEEQELHEHIDALWVALEPRADCLRDLKSRAKVDLFLGYRSNVDHGGLTIPFRSLEMFAALELDLGLSIVVVVD